ncbi:MAG: hypothetical protein KKF44_04395 [Nanoarchaeota archaeon]|nr:hypothetical protein [Nanoarchaeota archaeon]
MQKKEKSQPEALQPILLSSGKQYTSSHYFCFVGTLGGDVKISQHFFRLILGVSWQIFTI